MLENDSLLICHADYSRLLDLGRGTPLEAELDRATVVPNDRMPPDIVQMHSRVIYLDEVSGEQREVQLVYPEEADAARGKVSVLAPVGSALLGLKAGESIEWPFPGGRIRRLRVKSLRPCGSAALAGR